MARHFGLAFFSLAGMILALAFMNVIPTFTVDTFLLLATVTSLILLARPSPAAVRSFWRRLTARVDYTVASTT